MPKNEREDELYSSIGRMKPLYRSQIKSLDFGAFIIWSIAAIEFWPFNDQAKDFYDKALACSDNQWCTHLNVELSELDGFIDWSEHAVDLHPAGPEVQEVITLFDDHRNQVKAREDLLRHEIKNYWQP